MEDLGGKVAVITGGGTGIGRAIAVALGEVGARVVICGRRRAPLDETLEKIRSLGGEAVSVQADVSQEKDVEKVLNTALENYGAVDILVNNAGIDGGTQIHQHDIEDWDRVMAINLRGSFLFSRAVLPHMRGKGRGHIINISSESGIDYYKGDGVYGVSKHALNALGEFIQRENQEHNIRVDAVCPGMVVTEMTQDSPGLIHKNCLEPEDVAELVMFLLTRRLNIKIGTPILIQTMMNPWE